MKLLKFSNVLLIFLSFMMFTGCDEVGQEIPNQETIELKVEITSDSWYYRNISTEWQDLVWEKNPDGSGYQNGSTAFFDFILWYEGDEIHPGELISFKAKSGNIEFNVPVNENTFIDSSSTPNKHGFDGLYFYRSGDTSHSMPLGPWTFTLDFSDGSQTVYTRTFNKPGTTDIIENSYYITEDYGVGDSTHFQMIKQAQNVVASCVDGTVTVAFSTDDNLVRSGWVWIYDADGNYLGYSDRFVDSDDIVSPKLTSGFNIDGTANTFTINLSADLSSSITTTGDYYAVVLLIDGNHYTSAYFDGISYSAPALFSFTTP